MGERRRASPRASRGSAAATASELACLEVAKRLILPGETLALAADRPAAGASPAFAELVPLEEGAGDRC